MSSWVFGGEWRSGGDGSTGDIWTVRLRGARVLAEATGGAHCSLWPQGAMGAPHVLARALLRLAVLCLGVAAAALRPPSRVGVHVGARGARRHPPLRLRGAGEDDEVAARERELASLREALQQSEETLDRALAREEEELEEQEEQACIRAGREQRRRERAGETAFLRSVAIRDAEGSFCGGPGADVGARVSPPHVADPGSDMSTLSGQRSDASAAEGAPRHAECAGVRAAKRAEDARLSKARWDRLRMEEGISAGDGASGLGSFPDSDLGSDISARAKQHAERCVQRAVRRFEQVCCEDVAGRLVAVNYWQ